MKIPFPLSISNSDSRKVLILFVCLFLPILTNASACRIFTMYDNCHEYLSYNTISLRTLCEIYSIIIVYSYPLVEMVQTQIWNQLHLNQQIASLHLPYKDMVLKVISFCHPWKVTNLLGILSHHNIVIQYIILEAVLIQSQGKKKKKKC